MVPEGTVDYVHQQRHIQRHQAGHSRRLRQQQQYNRTNTRMMSTTASTDTTTITTFSVTVKSNNVPFENTIII